MAKIVEPIVTGTPNAISTNRMEPVDNAIAFALAESDAHFGKVAIAIG
ncbi:hypothetical protein ACO2JO_00465 [Leptospira interrogans]